MVSDPHKLEEFFLTIGLAYRDMVILHTDRDPGTVQQTLPEYMNASCSHLMGRIKDVCDTILRTTSEEIKHHTLKTSPVVQTDRLSIGPVVSLTQHPPRVARMQPALVVQPHFQRSAPPTSNPQTPQQHREGRSSSFFP